MAGGPWLRWSRGDRSWLGSQVALATSGAGLGRTLPASLHLVKSPPAWLRRWSAPALASPMRSETDAVCRVATGRRPPWSPAPTPGAGGTTSRSTRARLVHPAHAGPRGRRAAWSVGRTAARAGGPAPLGPAAPGPDRPGETASPTGRHRLALHVPAVDDAPAAPLGGRASHHPRRECTQDPRRRIVTSHRLQPGPGGGKLCLGTTPQATAAPM